MDLKTKLYISDLDQTLLQPHAELSDFAVRNLNNLIEKGVNFTVASARSVKSQQPIFKDVKLKLPVIEFNGSFISDLKTGKHLIVNELEDSALEQAARLFNDKKLHFFVSTFDGRQDRLHYSKVNNKGEEWYVQDRLDAGDSRLHYVKDRENHFNEQVVCLTVIDRLEQLAPLEQKLLLSGEKVEIHIQENQYTPGWYWLTVHSHAATKDQAIGELCQLCGLDKAYVTAFGDNTNDIKMLKAADCGIAVSNALNDVRDCADKVIGSHKEDSVIRYIAEENGVDYV